MISGDGKEPLLCLYRHYSSIVAARAHAQGHHGLRNIHLKPQLAVFANTQSAYLSGK